MSFGADRRRLLAITALLVAVLFAGSALSAYSAPPTGHTSAGRSLGTSGFAFLGGLRTFGAAVIWNRIDPIFHEYYHGVPLEKQQYMLPHLRIVTLLDPQFVQGYYMASYMVAKGGNMEQGLAIAEDGLANNPKSGLMYANLAQLLMLQDRRGNLSRMVELAKAGTQPGLAWQTPDDQYDAYVMFRTVYKLAGEPAEEARVQRVIDEVKTSNTLSDHDHDGDGAQDH